MFDSLRGMAGMAGLMKDLPKIKAKLELVKEEVAKREVEASTGGGAVTAVANGKFIHFLAWVSSAVHFRKQYKIDAAIY